MACSNCHQEGHNIRTCPQRQSSSSSFGGERACAQCKSYSSSHGEERGILNTRYVDNQPSKRTVTCSNCHQEGHNIRTCPQRKSSSDSFGEERACAPPKSSSSSPSVYTSGSPHAETTKKEVNGTKTPSSWKNIAQFLTKIDSRQNRTEENRANIIKKLDSIPGKKFETPGHNVKTCPKLEGKTKTKENSPGQWLSPLAQERFIEGPTPKDGVGFIYMYCYENPKNEEDRNVWKIGRSKELPERRIQVQEKSNKENYQLVYHQSTPFRCMTESVIHCLLKAVREPRQHGDGKTEWFRGSRDRFERVVKDVIKEVQFAIENKYFEPTPLHSS